jgi:hypothetical protein
MLFEEVEHPYDRRRLVETGKRAAFGDEALAPQMKSSATSVERGSTVVPSRRMASAVGRYSLIVTSRDSWISRAR